MLTHEGEQTSPPQIQRRSLPGLAIASGIAINAVETVLIEKGIDAMSNVLAWRQTLLEIEHDPFFGNIVDFEHGNELLGHTTEYRPEELINHGSIVIGDSLAVGYVEGNPQCYPPEVALANGASRGQLATKLQDNGSSLPQVHWYFKMYGQVGATINDTSQQIEAIRRDVFDLTDSPSADTQEYQDLILSAGGNDFLDYLTSIQNYLNNPQLLRTHHNALKQSFSEFLQNFSRNYKELMVQLLAATKRNDTTNTNSPFAIKRVFVYGLPNPANVTLGPLEETIIHQLGSYQNQALRLLIGSMASRVNLTMLAALEELKEENPHLTSGIDISFLNLWDLDLNGIHPTPEAYIQLAKERAACSILPLDGTQQTFDQLIGDHNIAF